MAQNLPSQVLRSLLALTEKRESIVSQLEKLDAEITAAFQRSTDGGPINLIGPPARVRGGKKAVASTRKRGKRGALKGLILSALETAGAAGVAVKDLASKLGVKPQNVHVWFATTGKKHAEKTGKGVYRLKGAKPVEVKVEAPAPAAKPAPKKAPKTKAKAKAKPVAKAAVAKVVKPVKKAVAKTKAKAKAKAKPAKKAAAAPSK